MEFASASVLITLTASDGPKGTTGFEAVSTFIPLRNFIPATGITHCCVDDLALLMVTLELEAEVIFYYEQCQT